MLTATGHRRRITVSSRSEKEATRKLRDKIAQFDEGIPVAGESWTVEQYFGYWLDHLVKVKRPKTYQGYEGIVRRYIVPELGRRKLECLTVQDVRGMLTRLQYDCRCCRDAIRDDGRVLSVCRRDNQHWEPPGGVLKLHETFDQGVRREILEETVWVPNRSSTVMTCRVA